jgi:uncharacterized protein involved in exopolysaccharide biosynthesis
VTDQPKSHNFWLFLELLTRRRKLIFTVVIVITLLSAGVSFILPKWYQAEALLLPPKNVTIPESGLNNLTEAVSVTGGLDLPVMATPSDLYARILSSRTITSRIINQYHLKQRYHAKNFEETYLALIKHAKIRVTGEGLLSIKVEDKDPNIAADMANSFVDELDSLNRRIVGQRIDETRTFIESRLTQVKNELDSARRSLERFQVENKAVDFDEQTRLAVEQAIKLKVSLAQVDLELRMGELSYGKDNAKLIEMRNKRKFLQSQLDALETHNSDSSFFSLPVASIPELKGQYEILYSRVKVAEALYQVLLQQREQAKIKEYEKMPTVSVLDRAEAPEVKSRPQRSLIVLGSFGMSILIAIFLAALLEYFKRLKGVDPEDYDRAMRFISAFFGWLPGVKRRK